MGGASCSGDLCQIHTREEEYRSRPDEQPKLGHSNSVGPSSLGVQRELSSLRKTYGRSIYQKQGT